MAKPDSFPLQITFRNIDSSAAIEAKVHENAGRLGRLHQRITSCRVVISAPERRHHRERQYVVRINIAVPGANIWINRGNPQQAAHTDVYVAIRDAFAAAVRKLEDHVRRHEGSVKRHDVEPHGVVTLLNSDEGYGFIETAAGEEIYFHRTSVVNDAFTRLKAGSKVRFVLGTKSRGSSPQASTVRVVGKHSPVGPD